MSFQKKMISPLFILDNSKQIAYRCKRTFYQIKRNILKKFSIINYNDRNIHSFRNIHKDQRCFVIGNGPSLKMQDLQKLHELNEISFAFNKIYLAFDETDYRPTYYMIADRMVASNIHKEVEKLEPFKKFFPYDYKKLFGHLPNTYFYYVENKLRMSIKTPCFSPDPFNICIGETVTYMALQLAVFFGCNPIYIIGVDFSFSIPKTKKKGDKTIVIGEGEKNHFHPLYRPKGEKWYVPDFDFQKSAYEQARKYAENNGIQIYNATRGGKLDVFERRDLDLVLSR